MSASDIRAYAIHRPDDDETNSANAGPSAKVVPERAGTKNVRGSVSVDDATPALQHVTTAVANPGETDAKEEQNKPNSAVSSQSGDDQQSADDGRGATENPVGAAPASSQRAKPMSPKERMVRSARNLEAISTALQRYLKVENLFPPAAAYDSAGTPLLSWRVLILPYLGHKDLYEQFRLDEPWYTPHNKRLIERIPPEFQSPERFDTKTNYLAVVGGSAAFDPTRKNGVHPRRFEDGVDDTVLVVEVDDEAAVTWTQPEEYQVDPTQPADRLGMLRDGRFFVAWGSGMVGLASASAPRKRLAAMYSRDGGESFSFSLVNRPLETALEELAVGTRGGSPSTDGASANSSEAVSTGTKTELHATAVESHASMSTSALAHQDRSSLVQEYLAAADDAYQLGRIPDALRWWYAAAIVSPASADWHRQFGWVPGLKRPRPFVQVAVGLDYSGPAHATTAQRVGQRGGPATRRSAKEWSARNRRLRNAVAKLTAPFGQSLLALLDEHAATAEPGWLAAFGSAEAARTASASISRKRRDTHQRRFPRSLIG